MTVAAASATSRHGRAGAVVVGALTQTTLGILPAFLAGAVAVQLQRSLHVAASRLGFAVMVFFLCSAVGYAGSGQVVERLGSRRAGRCGLLLALATLAGLAAAGSFAMFIAFMMLGGAANSICQLTSNYTIAVALPVRFQGFAFGLKQAAVPLATTLGGMSVPVLVVRYGWRSAFLAGVALAVPVLVCGRVLGSDPPATRAAQREGAAARFVRTRKIWLLTACAALGTAAINSVALFFVSSAVAHGVAESRAALLLAAGSMSGLVARVVVGFLADRAPDNHLVLVGVLLCTGAVAFATLAWDASPALMVIQTAGVFAAGWGWSGLLTYAVVRMHPGTPAQATGMTQAGVSVGGALGPFAAGLLVDGGSYRTVWFACAATVAVAGALAFVVAAADRRDRIGS